MPHLVFNPFTASLDYVTSPGEYEREGVALQGAVNNTNTTFTTPEKFVHEVGGASIKIYYNGQRLRLGDDYSVAESGGVGTGHDTVVLVFAPRSTPKYTDKLIADYHLL